MLLFKRLKTLFVSVSFSALNEREREREREREFQALLKVKVTLQSQVLIGKLESVIMIAMIYVKC